MKTALVSDLSFWKVNNQNRVKFHRIIIRLQIICSCTIGILVNILIVVWANAELRNRRHYQHCQCYIMIKSSMSSAPAAAHLLLRAQITKFWKCCQNCHLNKSIIMMRLYWLLQSHNQLALHRLLLLPLIASSSALHHIQQHYLLIDKCHDNHQYNY